jgi:hypothetical protein
VNCESEDDRDSRNVMDNGQSDGSSETEVSAMQADGQVDSVTLDHIYSATYVSPNECNISENSIQDRQQDEQCRRSVRVQSRRDKKSMQRVDERLTTKDGNNRRKKKKMQSRREKESMQSRWLQPYRCTACKKSYSHLVHLTKHCPIHGKVKGVVPFL